MNILLLASLLTSMVSALPASTLANETETEIIWDTNSAIDINTGPSLRDETGPAKEDLEPDNSIVGGYRARQGEFPTTISVLRFGSHVCGASLINSNTALTAAHCVDMGGSFSVAAGTNSWEFGGVRSFVSQIIIHSGYVRSTFDNDFAILKLSTRIPQTGLIAYARLPPAGSDPAHNTPAIVAGWGALTFQGPQQPELLAVRVPVIHPDTCENLVFPSLFTENMICAGFPEGGRSVCNGDSGGPLYNLFTGETIGVVSWGRNGCAAPGNPGVYARVGRVISFIQFWSD